MFGDVIDELNGLSEADLVTYLHELERQRRHVEASLAAVIDLASRTGLFRADGHRSVRGWIKTQINCTDTDAAHLQRLGRLVHDLPEVGDRLGNGDIGIGQARELARVNHNPRCTTQLPESAPILLEHAATLPFNDFRACVRRWEFLADPDGAFKDRHANQQSRTASVFDNDGGVLVRAEGGTATVAAEMLEIFAAFCHGEFLADWDQAVALHGTAANASHMPRTDPQRRFDALAAIFRAAATAPRNARTPEPTVNFVIDQHTFEQHLRRRGGGGTGLAVADHSGWPGSNCWNDADIDLGTEKRFNLDETRTDSTNPSPRHPIGNERGSPRPSGPLDPWWRRSETTSGVLVHPDDILAAALTGHVRRVVYDSAGTIIDLGRRRRLFTGAARDAALLNSRHCIWPGCDIPTSRCHADHLTPWSASGTTTSTNGAPLCRHHNQTKNSGYTTRRDAQGRWHTHRPNGTEISGLQLHTDTA